MEEVHWAAYAGDLAEVNRLLAEDPGRLNAQDVNGCTPLVLAASQGQDAVLARLLALGADVGLSNNSQRTAVYLACYSNRVSALDLLLDAGASINARDKCQETPLMTAALNDAVDCVSVLLARSSAVLELDAMNTAGWTALHCAAIGSPQIVSLLLKADADPTIRNNDEQTPLDLARLWDHQESVQLLQAALAEPQRPRLLLKARALIDAAHEQRHIHSAGAGHRVDMEEDGDGAAAAPAGPRRSSRIASRARVVAAAPAYLRGRVERREPLPSVETTTDTNDELGACLRFVLGLQGHGGCAGAEDERATMRTEGLFPELFIELCELLVPRWDRKNL